MRIPIRFATDGSIKLWLVRAARSRQLISKAEQHEIAVQRRKELQMWDLSN